MLPEASHQVSAQEDIWLKKMFNGFQDVCPSLLTEKNCSRYSEIILPGLSN